MKYLNIFLIKLMKYLNVFTIIELLIIIAIIAILAAIVVPALKEARAQQETQQENQYRIEKQEYDKGQLSKVHVIVVERVSKVELSDLKDFIAVETSTGSWDWGVETKANFYDFEKIKDTDVAYLYLFKKNLQ